ncbi:hypothetical protein [Caulobacter sp. S45]|uniref:hypothetical protein n=1 Tax=Caulobacter sp. S45 TaxID=1641861 RepID=UPI00131AE716|nr:hypothetical protein [Caulobacter sp. S45]
MSWKPIDTAPRNGKEIVVAYRRPRNAAVIVAVSAFELGEWIWSEESDQDEMLTAGDIPFAWIEMPD